MRGWRLIANLLLTRLASMFACNSGASRQFDTYLMDKVVMQILEGKGIGKIVIHAQDLRILKSLGFDDP